MEREYVRCLQFLVLRMLGMVERYLMHICDIGLD